MKDRDDAAIVADCLAGKPRAFDVLVDRYQKLVFNIAFRILNDGEDAADVTQSVFIKTYEHLNRYDSRYKFFSWLYRIASNESLNALKARRPVESLNDDLLSDKQTPEDSFIASEDNRLVQEALLQLTPEYRIVVVLCHVNDLSYREISEILEIPEKTVKSRLFSARKQLRTNLLKLTT